jgi:hypothetical protein
VVQNHRSTVYKRSSPEEALDRNEPCHAHTFITILSSKPRTGHFLGMARSITLYFGGTLYSRSIRISPPITNCGGACHPAPDILTIV